MNKFLVILSVFVLFQSCKTESIAPEDILVGGEYYPVFVGKVSEYEVFEVKYKPNSVDTLKYKLKEEISGLINDNGGVKTYHIQRFRADGNSDYIRDSLFSVQVSKNEVVRNQNNERLKILSFPIQTEDSWDKNVYINKTLDELSYSNLNHSFGGYSSTIRTSHKVSSNIINQNERYNVYAEGVGLVYSYYNVTSQQPNEPKSGEFKTITLIK